MAKLEYQERDGKVFCPLANKWLVAKPEEKVRPVLLGFFGKAKEIISSFALVDTPN